FFYRCGHPLPPHSFPTRRSSDLRIPAQEYLAAVLREVALIRAADPAPAAGSLRELGSGNEAPPSVVEPEAGLQTLYFGGGTPSRSEEHTSELQSRSDLVCRLLLE